MFQPLASPLGASPPAHVLAQYSFRCSLQASSGNTLCTKLVNKITLKRYFESLLIELRGWHIAADIQECQGSILKPGLPLDISHHSS